MIFYKKHTFNNNETAVDDVKYLLAKLKTTNDFNHLLRHGTCGEIKRILK